MTAAAEGVTITMVGDPQVQARLFGIAHTRSTDRKPV
jgi:hypothetical protein